MKFQLGLGLVSSVESIKSFISILSPDNESSEMTTRGEMKNVQAVNVEDINTGKVAESSEEGSLLFVDDQGTFSLDVSPVSGFSFAGSNLLGILDFLDISISLQGLEEFYSLRGFVKGSDSAGANNEGNFRDFLDSVTSGENKRGGR